MFCVRKCNAIRPWHVVIVAGSHLPTVCRSKWRTVFMYVGSSVSSTLYPNALPRYATWMAQTGVEVIIFFQGVGCKFNLNNNCINLIGNWIRSGPDQVFGADWGSWWSAYVQLLFQSDVRMSLRTIKDEGKPSNVAEDTYCTRNIKGPRPAVVHLYWAQQAR